jgi:beta-glucosidase
VLQAWFGGQEMANAVAAVLTGALEPSGRLPTTVPVRLEHNPSYGTFPGENSTHRYGEGLLVGYRWYEARHLEPRFAFGHGLSYTSFSFGQPRLSSAVFVRGQRLSVTVPVTNTGGRAGAEVVQCYVAPLAPRLVRPVKELKAFAKVWVEPGQTVEVSLELGDRAFAYWDPGDEDWWRLHDGTPPEGDGHRRDPGWSVDPGEYHLCTGRSSADIAHVALITVIGSH